MLQNAATVIRPITKRVALTRTLASMLVLAAALIAVPASSAGAATGPPTLDLSLKNNADLLDKVTATGVLPGAIAGENVTVQIDASGKTLDKKQVAVGGDGSFSYSFTVDACCNYEVTASSAGLSSDPQRFSVDVPKHLRKGPIAHLFNQKLIDAGYYIGGGASSRVTGGTRLALCAFRKVNNMARNFSYKPAIFRKLLMGRGEFVPRYHENHHVEVDISRQVMAFVDGDKVVATFHVSTGKSSTPTVRGTFHFYRKEPGTNSHGMFMSVYFIRGYATHGYPSVPTHEAASHGCVRNPIPFSVYIYNWINLGDTIHVYG
jgi:L,D-transpeptidase catalytic domain